MSALQQLDAEADSVRRSIAADASAGSIALVDFSRRYARTPELKNAALALTAGVADVEDQAVLNTLRSKMTDVLDAVVADSAREDPETDSRLKARKRLFEQHRRTPSKRETICRLERLEMRFARSRFLLGPVSLELRSGEITAVLGENGYGKSTLLRTVVGQLRPTGGRVEFPALASEQRFRWASVAQCIGYLPQKLPDWHGSLEDMLFLRAALGGLSPSESETQVRYLVARLDLTEQMARQWSELSGGYQLRFALAQALVGKPRLLVLDEPLANLDLKKQPELLSDIQRLAKSAPSPIAVLISSHVIDPLQATADNVVFLKHGRVDFQGPTSEIGVKRTYNLYECDSALSVDALRTRLGNRVDEVRHNGIRYVIRTPLAVSYSDMLDLLKESGVEFTGCTDISGKAKVLFDET